MSASNEIVRILARQLINRLEHSGEIKYRTQDRTELTDRLAAALSPHLMTTQQIKEAARQVVDEKSAEAEEQGISLDDFYMATQKSMIKQFEGEEIGGLYLKKSPKNLSELILEFLMNEPLVEDVFGTDEELISSSLKTIQGFDPANIS